LRTRNRFGTPQRHGELLAMSDEDHARDMKLAWQVVDRYLVLLHRSVKRLSEGEFPLL